MKFTIFLFIKYILNFKQIQHFLILLFPTKIILKTFLINKGKNYNEENSLPDLQNITLKKLISLSRELRKMNIINLPNNFNRLKNNKLYNTLFDKIKIYNNNLDKLKQLKELNNIIKPFDEFDCQNKEEIYNFPFSKIKNYDDIFKTNKRLNKKITAFKGIIKTFEITNAENFKEPSEFLDSIKKDIISKIQNIFKKENNLKINTLFLCEFIRKNQI